MAKKDIANSELYINVKPQCRRGALPRGRIPLRTRGRDGDGFVFILEGKCHYTFDDGTFFTADKQDILYLANGAKYAMDVDCESYKFFVVDFLFTDIAPRQSAVYHPHDKAGTEQLFARICAKREFPSPSAAAESLSLFYRILRAVIESKQSRYVSGKARATVEKAAEAVQKMCCDSSLSVAGLAADASMSEVHFRRLFARSFGISPAKYIMRARVDRAKMLMSDHTLSLTDIAEQSGFSSSTYFYRVFREVTGTTPAAYRKELSVNPL